MICVSLYLMTSIDHEVEDWQDEANNAGSRNRVRNARTAGAERGVSSEDRRADAVAGTQCAD